jgi:glycosyltransferase involved in cell wall biosynthesis
MLGINLLNSCVKDIDRHFTALQYTVKSLLESDVQNYDWRMVVVDDGSTCPKTLSYLDVLSQVDSRIHVIRHSSVLGIPKAKDAGYRYLLDTDTDYLVELHHDMIFPKMWMGPLISHLEENESTGIVCSGIVLSYNFPMTIPMDSPYGLPYEKAKPMVEEECAKRRVNVTNIGNVQPMVKRTQLAREIGLCDPNLPAKQSGQDADEWYRMHLKGYQSIVDLNSFVYHHMNFSRGHLIQIEYGVNHPAEYEKNWKYLDGKYGEDWIAWKKKYYLELRLRMFSSKGDNKE